MLIWNGFLIYTLMDYEKSLFCWKIREEKGNIKLNIGAASCEQAMRTSVISLSSDARATRHTRLPARLSNISYGSPSFFASFPIWENIKRDYS